MDQHFSERGQSLVEIIIALAIGAILIGAASTAVIVVLQSGESTQEQRTAAILAQEYIEQVRAYTRADWNNVYNLSKGSSTPYFLTASSTEMVAIAGIEGVAENNIQDGLVGYWKLDESSSTTAYDNAAHANHGAIGGAVATSTDFCMIGGCFTFDGSNDYISVPYDSSLGVTSFSVSLWIYPESWGQAQRFFQSHFVMWDSGSDLRFTYYDGTSWNATVFPYSLGPAGLWHHFVYTHDENSGSKAYIDGTQIDAGGEAEPAVASGGSFYFGSGNASGWNPFYGSLDDIRVYDRALTGSEVQDLFNTNRYRRYFYVENVCRTNDANNNIVGTTPCSGSLEDPSTQKVTVVIEDAARPSGTSLFTLSEYVTRWRNQAFNQTDWSGGGGQDDPITRPNDQYSTSTDIQLETGQFRIEGL